MPALKFTNPSCITVVPSARCAPRRTRSASAIRTPLGQDVVGHPRELVDAEDARRDRGPRAEPRAGSPRSRPPRTGPPLVHTTLVSRPKTPSRLIAVRGGQPVAEQVQTQPGVVRVGGRRLEVLHDGGHHHPAHVAGTSSSPSSWSSARPAPPGHRHRRGSRGEARGTTRRGRFPAGRGGEAMAPGGFGKMLRHPPHDTESSLPSAHRPPRETAPETSTETAPETTSETTTETTTETPEPFARWKELCMDTASGTDALGCFWAGVMGCRLEPGPAGGIGDVAGPVEGAGHRHVPGPRCQDHQAPDPPRRLHRRDRDPRRTSGPR